MEDVIKIYISKLYKNNYEIIDTHEHSSDLHEYYLTYENEMIMVFIKEYDDASLKSCYLKNLEYNIILKNMIIKFGMGYFKDMVRKNEIIEPSCCVCLNDYNDNKNVIYCGHSCCSDCYIKIDKCPICRAKINYSIFEEIKINDLMDIFDIDEFYSNVVLRKLFIKKYRFIGFDKYINFSGKHLFLNIVKIVV